MNAYLKIPLVIATVTALLVVTLAGLLLGAYYYVAPTLPRAEELRDLKMQIPLQVYSRDGRLIQEFGEQKRTPVAYQDIPPLLIKAVLAAEDDRFFEHPGLDYQGILRAFINVIVTGGDRSIGGSTITQQVARMNFLNRERLYVRKFKEAILALRIEREFTKEEILALYLNTYFFGQQSYGVAAAARTYFGKDLEELTVAEAALIAGLPQGPSIFNPIYSPKGAKQRRSYVLRRMRETGAITDAQYADAMAEPIVPKRYGMQTRLQAPYVAEMVRAEMIRRFGPAAYTAGLKVTTTIDSRLQRAANRAIRTTLTAYDERHGYRGPLAHVELPAEAGGEDPEQAFRKLLDDYPSLVDLETALVLDVNQDSARLFFAGRGEQTIGLDAVAWAAPFIDDDTAGARPKAVSDVLHAGDIVRFRQDAEGGWRLAQIPEVQGAFVAEDPRDGAIVALNGGYDFFLSNFNRATQSRRQPGSAFKPFMYSAALENGFTPATIVTDAPVNVGYDPVLERVWRPENYHSVYHGDTRLREALAESMNAAAIRVLQQVTVPKVVRYVHKFGFDSVAVPEDLTLALGSGGVAPVDLVNGYATFANGGYAVEHYFIQRITDAQGDVLYDASPVFACPDCASDSAGGPTAALPASTAAATATPSTPEVAEPALIDDPTELYPPLRVAPAIITPQNAYLMTDMMQDVVRHGTGVAAYRALERRDLAGKTGTTNDGRDTWFVGFNADVVAASWVGFDQDDRPLGRNEQGGYTAIPMWIGFMETALAGTPEHEVPLPPGIVEYRINPKNGLIANDTTPNTIFEKFEIDNIPEHEPEPAFPGPFHAPGPTDTDKPVTESNNPFE